MKENLQSFMTPWAEIFNDVVYHGARPRLVSSEGENWLCKFFSTPHWVRDNSMPGIFHAEDIHEQLQNLCYTCATSIS